MTLWTPLFAVACIAFAFALGNYVANKTKGIISTLIVGCVLFIVGFLTGIIPTNVVVLSGFAGMLGTFVIPFCIIDVGSKLHYQQLKKEWKTVLMSLSGTIGIILTVGTLGWLIFGKQYALAAIPPLSGALLATTIVQQQAMQAGVPTIAVFTTIVLVSQFFCGLPLASLMLKRELKVLKSSGALLSYAEIGATVAQPLGEVEKPTKMLIPPLPAIWQSDFMILFKMAIIGAIALAVAQLTVIPGSNPTNYILNPFLSYMLFAMLAANIGLLERSPLDVSKSRGIVYLALFSVLLHTLSSISGADIAAQFIPTIGTILIGAMGILIACWLISKLIKTTPWIAIAVGFTCFLGYPGSQIVVEEAVRGSDLTAEEQKAASDILIPRMVLGYFVAAITSVIIAGIVAPLIFS